MCLRLLHATLGTTTKVCFALAAAPLHATTHGNANVGRTDGQSQESDKQELTQEYVTIWNSGE